jgi:glycosyltransferase involved in cell wall biosynthesis
MRRNLVIDLRMYKMSGIGRYLQALIPGLIPRVNATRISILGSPAEMGDAEWMQDSHMELREFRAPIFSIAEQWAGMRGLYSDCDRLWSPQYNIPLFYRGKLLVTIYDLCQLAYPETLGSDLQRWYARYLLSAVAARAAASLCISEYTANEVQKYLGVDRSKLVITYPAISNEWRESNYVRSASGDSPYLLAVGNIKKHKNLKVLIAAFESIQNRIPHRLIIVGKQEGFLNPETDLIRESTLLGGRVQFTGHISEQALHNYYRNADALVLPSFYEGFGYPIVEAMALGCPVVCSNVSSLPEVAGDAALLFDPFSMDAIANALVMIACDGELRTTLIERGQKRVEGFFNDKCAEKTASLINRLLEDSG